MNTSQISGIVMKTSLALLCTTSSVCICRVTNKIISTMDSADRVMNSAQQAFITTNGKVLPSVANAIDKCSNDGISIDAITSPGSLIPKTFNIQFKEPLNNIQNLTEHSKENTLKSKEANEQEDVTARLEKSNQAAGDFFKTLFNPNSSQDDVAIAFNASTKATGEFFNTVFKKIDNNTQNS